MQYRKARYKKKTRVVSRYQGVSVEERYNGYDEQPRASQNSPARRVRSRVKCHANFEEELNKLAMQLDEKVWLADQLCQPARLGC